MTTPRADGSGQRLQRLTFSAASLQAALRAESRTLVVIGVGAALVILTMVLRLLFLDSAYDVFTDEITYLRLAEGFVSGNGINLYGGPFLLHPPLFFILEGPVTGLIPATGTVIDQVQAIRTLNVILAAATAATLFAIALRVAGLTTAVVVAVLFAVDPFVVRLNSRNLLETSTMLWILLGFLALVTADLDPGRRLSTKRSIVIGLLFGCAILTKEMAVFLTFVPLGVLFITRWATTRRSVLMILATAATVYAIYPLAILLAGLGPAWVSDKASGLLRFAGIVKSTGFVASGGPSFVAAIVNNLDVFGMTYLLIALGVPASVVLLRDRSPGRRVLGVVCACAYVLLAFSIAIGTLEEQFFYYLGVAAILGVPVAAASLIGRRRAVAEAASGDQGAMTPSGREPAGLRGTIALLASAFLLAAAIGWSLSTWTQVHLAADNGYEQVGAFLRSEVEAGATIGFTSDPQQFLLDGFDLQPVESSSDIGSKHVEYVIVSTKQIQDGYTANGAEIYAWLQENATPAFAFTGRTYGRIEVFRIAADDP